MHRTLERLDAAASTIVPLLYLAGLALGVLSYFTGLTGVDFGIAVGVGLATAAELHSFLQQRRVRAAWAVLSRTPQDDPRRDQLATQFRVNVALLVALIAFSSYNAVAFAAATWRPSPGFLPPSIQIAIRGLVVPALFLASGFLVPLQADAGALLASASHDMLHKTIRATVRQWRRRVDRAQRRGHDLAPIAVALMLDAGDLDGARRVRMIADGLDAAEGNVTDYAETPRSDGPPVQYIPVPDPIPDSRPLPPGAARLAVTRSNVRVMPERAPRADIGTTDGERQRLRELRVAAVRKYLAQYPEPSLRQLAAFVGRQTKRRCSLDTAQKIKRWVETHPEAQPTTAHATPPAAQEA